MANQKPKKIDSLDELTAGVERLKQVSPDIRRGKDRDRVLAEAKSVIDGTRAIAERLFSGIRGANIGPEIQILQKLKGVVSEQRGGGAQFKDAVNRLVGRLDRLVGLLREVQGWSGSAEELEHKVSAVLRGESPQPAKPADGKPKADTDKKLPRADGAVSGAAALQEAVSDSLFEAERLVVNGVEFRVNQEVQYTSTKGKAGIYTIKHIDPTEQKVVLENERTSFTIDKRSISRLEKSAEPAPSPEPPVRVEAGPEEKRRKMEQWFRDNVTRQKRTSGRYKVVTGQGSKSLGAYLMSEQFNATTAGFTPVEFVQFLLGRDGTDRAELKQSLRTTDLDLLVSAAGEPAAPRTEPVPGAIPRVEGRGEKTPDERIDEVLRTMVDKDKILLKDGICYVLFNSQPIRLGDFVQKIRRFRKVPKEFSSIPGVSVDQIAERMIVLAKNELWKGHDREVKASLRPELVAAHRVGAEVRGGVSFNAFQIGGAPVREHQLFWYRRDEDSDPYIVEAVGVNEGRLVVKNHTGAGGQDEVTPEDWDNAVNAEKRVKSVNEIETQETFVFGDGDDAETLHKGQKFDVTTDDEPPEVFEIEVVGLVRAGGEIRLSLRSTDTGNIRLFRKEEWNQARAEYIQEQPDAAAYAEAIQARDTRILEGFKGHPKFLDKYVYTDPDDGEVEVSVFGANAEGEIVLSVVDDTSQIVQFSQTGWEAALALDEGEKGSLRRKGAQTRVETSAETENFETGVWRVVYDKATYGKHPETIPEAETIISRKTAVGVVDGISNYGGEQSKYDDRNEDSLLVHATEELVYVAVVDGAGGSGDGLRASAVTNKKLEEVFAEKKLLRKSLLEANTHLAAMNKDEGRNKPEEQFYCTAVAVRVEKATRRVSVGCVGDSKVFTIRDGKKLDKGSTKFQNRAQEDIDANRIAPEGYYNHREKSIITSCIGVERECFPKGSAFDGKTGDRVVLASDGLWDLVSEYEVMQLSARHPTTEAFRQALYELALERNVGGTYTIQHAEDVGVEHSQRAGRGDNITIAVLDLEFAGEQAATQQEPAPQEGEPTSTRPGRDLPPFPTDASAIADIERKSKEKPPGQVVDATGPFTWGSITLPQGTRIRWREHNCAVKGYVEHEGNITHLVVEDEETNDTRYIPAGQTIGILDSSARLHDTTAEGQGTQTHSQEPGGALDDSMLDHQAQMNRTVEMQRREQASRQQEPARTEIPEHRPTYVDIPPAELVELIGAEKFQRIYRLFLEGDPQEVDDYMYDLFNGRLDQRGKERVTERLGKLGFESFEAFRTLWEEGLYRIMMELIAKDIRARFERTVLSDPEMTEEDVKTGGLFKRVVRGIRDNLPAIGAGIGTVALLGTGPAGMAAAGVVSVATKRWWERDKEKKKVQRQEAKRERIEKRVKKTLLAQMKKNGELTIASLLSNLMREATVKPLAGGQTPDAWALWQHALKERASRVEGGEVLDAQAQALIAGLHTRNNLVERPEVPDEIKNTSFFKAAWAQIQEASRTQLWMHDENKKKRVIGDIIALMTGGATGYAIGLAEGAFVIRSLVRGGVGFATGAVGELSKDALLQADRNKEFIVEKIEKHVKATESVLERLHQGVDLQLPMDELGDQAIEIRAAIASGLLGHDSDEEDEKEIGRKNLRRRAETVVYEIERLLVERVDNLRNALEDQNAKTEARAKEMIESILPKGEKSLKSKLWGALKAGGKRAGLITGLGALFEGAKGIVNSDMAKELFDNLMMKLGIIEAPALGTDYVAQTQTRVIEDHGGAPVEVQAERVHVGVYSIHKGEGLLHAANHFQKTHGDEIIAGMKRAYPGLSDKELIHRWRVQEVERFGVLMQDEEDGGWLYDKTLNEGAPIELYFDDKGIPHLGLADDSPQFVTNHEPRSYGTSKPIEIAAGGRSEAVGNIAVGGGGGGGGTVEAAGTTTGSSGSTFVKDTAGTSVAESVAPKEGVPRSVWKNRVYDIRRVTDTSGRVFFIQHGLVSAQGGTSENIVSVLFNNEGDRVGFYGPDRKYHFGTPGGGWPEGTPERTQFPTEATPEKSIAQKAADETERQELKTEGEVTVERGRHDMIDAKYANPADRAGLHNLLYYLERVRGPLMQGDKLEKILFDVPKENGGVGLSRQDVPEDAVGAFKRNYLDSLKQVRRWVTEGKPIDEISALLRREGGLAGFYAEGGVGVEALTTELTNGDLSNSGVLVQAGQVEGKIIERHFKTLAAEDK